MKVKIVYGAPCSGKTTFVKESITENDIFYDYDVISCAISISNSNTKLIKYCINIRDIILKTAKENKDIDTLYIISCKLKEDLLDQLTDIEVEYILINKTEDEVLEQLEKDNTRIDKEYWKKLILEWFEWYKEYRERRCRMLNKEKEIRQLNIEKIETRTEDNGNMIIEGYVATFSSKSKYMGFYEIINPKAFDSTLADGHNIFMLYNHDWDKPLGDTETGTLKLEVDNIGLKFSLTLDNTVSYAKDVYQLVKKNLIKGCSFGFCVNEDEWSMNDNMEDIRTLLSVTLLECTLTIAPAYNETKASCRSFEQHKQDLEQHKLLKRKLKLELELM